MTDDVDRLPGMSPVYWPDPPPRPARGSIRLGRHPMWMVFPGFGLMLVSFWVFMVGVLGPAMETDEPDYWSDVVRRIRHFDGGRVSVPTILGMMVGAGFFIDGFRRAFRASRLRVRP